MASVQPDPNERFRSWTKYLERATHRNRVKKTLKEKVQQADADRKENLSAERYRRGLRLSESPDEVTVFEHLSLGRAELRPRMALKRPS